MKGAISARNFFLKVKKMAKIRNQYNKVPHLMILDNKCEIYKTQGNIKHKGTKMPALFLQVRSRRYNIIMRRERSGLIVECLTRDLETAGSSLIGVTALCP